jgi:hypothetical protein
LEGGSRSAMRLIVLMPAPDAGLADAVREERVEGAS